ncbi:MAG: ABC transporter permease, partial [Lachnospiraceae bacterium]|nr:ABC transporter permease [Lachnospiraceae bacterium]
MKLTMSWKMAVSAVLSNKLRSFLTMLGIIIGVMAVTLLISLVQGASDSVTDQLDQLGGNQLVVSVRGGNKRLTLHEIRSLEGKDGIKYVSPVISGNGNAVKDTNHKDVSVTGITERYKDLQGIDLEAGRNITQNDLDYRLNVAIIGQSVADELFGTRDVIGKTFRLSGKSFRVAGLLEEAQETLMGSLNDSVYIPFTTAQRLFSNTAISSFYVSASDIDRLEDAERVLKNVLRDKFGDEDRYSVVNLTDVMDIIDRVMDTLSLLLGAIAGISLLVGGIGIMNIMLVSVTERTREIGIRKAIGALKGDIILQFLIESVILSLLGGLIGMAVSWGVLSTINRL